MSATDYSIESELSEISLNQNCPDDIFEDHMCSNSNTQYAKMFDEAFDVFKPEGATHSVDWKGWILMIVYACAIFGLKTKDFEWLRTLIVVVGVGSIHWERRYERSFQILVAGMMIGSISLMFQKTVFGIMVDHFGMLVLMGYLFTQDSFKNVNWFAVIAQSFMALLSAPFRLFHFLVDRPFFQKKIDMTMEPTFFSGILFPFIVTGIFVSLYASINDSISAFFSKIGSIGIDFWLWQFDWISTFFLQIFSLEGFLKSLWVLVAISPLILKAKQGIPAKTEDVSEEVNHNLPEEGMSEESKVLWRGFSVNVLRLLNISLIVLHFSNIQTLLAVDITSAPALSKAVHAGMDNVYWALAAAIILVLGLFTQKRAWLLENEIISSLSKVWIYSNMVLLCTTLLLDLLYIWHCGMTEARMLVVVGLLGMGSALKIAAHKLDVNETALWVINRSMEAQYVLFILASIVMCFVPKMVF